MEKQLGAFLSELAYESPEKRREKLAQHYSHLHIADGFNDDEHFSVVGDKELYNVHRGSTTKKDWLVTDPAILFDNLKSTDRYHDSAAKSNAANEIYGQGKARYEVGHSLGGTLAQEISQENGNKSLAYNPGTSPFKTYAAVDKTQHQTFRNSHDLISLFNPNTEATSTQRASYGNATVDKMIEKGLSGPIQKPELAFADKIFQMVKGHSIGQT